LYRHGHKVFPWIVRQGLEIVMEIVNNRKGESK